MNEPQAGDIWMFNFIKNIDPVYVLVENVVVTDRYDKIVHFLDLGTGTSNFRYIHTFLREKPTKVA